MNNGTSPLQLHHHRQRRPTKNTGLTSALRLPPRNQPAIVVVVVIVIVFLLLRACACVCMFIGYASTLSPNSALLAHPPHADSF
ncbi:hypothetical protein COCC4DRAFT_63390 [Bipolaris maydis ATCC 48331]|uniref:Uncharacterized protein n=2 Tax=Cochliobolus heterostrophus TaxID=5016 RepID=M2UEC9_COCH5|nr:uncharacterized protein COCC4DRAFT_63390 [Bipolaris maydis ATCC 48331]EMD92051.1 hypothetical protein COCHEDRAFT_1099057 [Bipolaris maydis C5]ENI02464.1 hypothetical protein COCC4DRAFT_63390 [Bipolaris maydis ATCC 48331]KAJ6210656.1 hypothetical protein PSV09DRAFT_1099057 [Bipolaris maydis]